MDDVDYWVFDSLIYLCHSTWLRRKSYQLFVRSSSALKSTNSKLSSLPKTSKSASRSWRSLRPRKRRQQQPRSLQPLRTNVHASTMEGQCPQPRLAARAMLMYLLSHQLPRLSGHLHTPNTLSESQPTLHRQPCISTGETEVPHMCTPPKLLLTQAPPTRHMEATPMAWHRLTIKLTTDRRRHNCPRQIW